MGFTGKHFEIFHCNLELMFMMGDLFIFIFFRNLKKIYFLDFFFFLPQCKILPLFWKDIFSYLLCYTLKAVIYKECLRP